MNIIYLIKQSSRCNYWQKNKFMKKNSLFNSEQFIVVSFKDKYKDFHCLWPLTFWYLSQGCWNNAFIYFIFLFELNVLCKDYKFSCWFSFFLSSINLALHFQSNLISDTIKINIYQLVVRRHMNQCYLSVRLSKP